MTPSPLRSCLILNKYLTTEPFDHGGRQNSKLWYGNTEAEVEANIGCHGVPDWFIDAATPMRERTKRSDHPS